MDENVTSDGSPAWDAVVEDFARVFAPGTAAYARELLDAVGARPGERLLDIAAGTGALALAAAAAGIHVVAIDSSPGMVRYLRRRAEEQALPNLAAEVMDGQALSFEDGSFDAACSVFGVFLFPEFRRGLSEARRVVRPGGRVGVTAWREPERMGHLQVWLEAIRAEYPAFAGLEPSEGRWLMQSPEGLAAVMREAGLSNVGARVVSHDWRFPSAEVFVRDVVWKPLLVPVFESLGEDSEDRVRARLRKSLRDRFGDGEFSLRAEAVSGVGEA